MEYKELTKLHVGSLVKSQDSSFNIGRIDGSTSVVYVYDQDGQPNYLDDLEGVKINSDFLLRWDFKKDKDQNIYGRKTKDCTVTYDLDNNILGVEPNSGSGFGNFLVCRDVQFVHEFWNLLNSVNVEFE